MEANSVGVSTCSEGLFELLNTHEADVTRVGCESIFPKKSRSASVANSRTDTYTLIVWTLRILSSIIHLTTL